MDLPRRRPMSGAERIRKWREKKGVDFKKSESKRIERQRKKRVEKMSAAELKQYRIAAAERQRSSRARKKQMKQSVTVDEPAIDQPATVEMNVDKSMTPYRCPQSFGKALQKTVRALPQSPRKRKAIVCGLADRFRVTLESEMTKELSPGNKGLSAETESAVIEFYFRSDIVYTMPGMKDTMAVWKNGKKAILQKHYLTMFLREAFAVFKETHADISLSFSSFCRLRPENVLLLKDTPSDQCKCRIHENFRLKLKALHIIYDNSWWELHLCSSDDLHSACWRGECTNCKEGKVFRESLSLDGSKRVSWQQWEKDDTNRLRKVFHESQTRELVVLVIESIPDFQEHVRVKRIQEKQFQHDKSESRVLEIDFAMAYSCEYQSEVQSALWSRSSVTLFTAALFHRNMCKTYLICSDTKDKEKNAVFTFVNELYQYIMKDMPVLDSEVEDVIFSDGPSSEFKNKYAMKMLYLLSNKFSKKFSWKYFATSHGKGVVDGIGGRAKSLVRQKVMSKSEHITVQSSEDFAKLASELMPSTTVIHISETEIQETVGRLDPWDYVPLVQGIKQMHVASAESSSGAIKLWHAAGQGDADYTIQYEERMPGHNPPKDDIAVGEWCVVNYENQHYPGEVIQIASNEYQVSVMVSSGNLWKWPERPDALYYRRNDIIKKISPPDVAGSRGQFRFKEL